MKKETRQILLRLSDDLVDALETRANALGVKRNDLIVAAVLDKLAIVECEEAFRVKPLIDMLDDAQTS